MPNEQIIINITDSIPPANVATIDKNGLTGTVDTKIQVNNKIKAAKEELSEMVQTDFKGIILPTDPTPTEDGSYRPGISSTDENIIDPLDFGTIYPNAGDLRAKKGYSTFFYKKGTSWTKSEEELPQATKNIPDFAAISFPAEAGTQVIYDDRLWQVKDGKIALSTDIPGDDVNNVWKSIVRQTINNISNNFDPDQIIPSEALYEDGTIAVDVEKRITTEGVDLNRRETTKWYDGSPMTDARVDDDIFIKRDGKYLQKTISKETLIKVGTIYELRQTNGYYEGQEVILLGYYESGDKDPVHYKFTVQHYSSAVDNGGLTIKTDRGVWVAQFNGKCSVKDFGAIKDTDCTDIINKALQLVDDVTISDQYKINPIGYVPTSATSTFRYTGGIKPRTGNTLRGLPGNKLYIDPNSATYYCIVNCERVNNVTLIDLNIEGDVETHLGTTGEWGYGISFKGCLNFKVINCNAIKCWGDGIALQCSKIAVGDVITGQGEVIGGNFDYCRRNGLSVISHTGRISGVSCKYNGTISGINPKYGIDVEPNNGGDDYIDVIFTDIYTEGNAEGGIEFVPAYMQDVRYVNPATFKVELNNYTSVNDGVITAQNTGSIRTVFADNNLANIIETKPINGYINVNNATIINSVKRAMTFSRVPDNGMSIQFNNIKIFNPYTNTTPETQRELKNAISFLTQSTQTTYGKVSINGLYIAEPKTGTNAIITGVFFKPVNETDKVFSNIIINNFEYSGTWNDTTEVPAYGATDKTVLVNMNKPTKLNYTATSSMHNYSVADYMELYINTPNVVVALPNTNIVKNKRIKVFAKNTAGSVFIQGRNDSQPINITPSNSRILGLTFGSSVTLEVANDGTWNILEYSGTIYNDQFPVKGTTAQRPSGLTTSNAGFQFYDTTVGNYILWNGSGWVTPASAKYRNIITNTYDLFVTTRKEIVEITPTANCVITLKQMTEYFEGAEITFINNTNFTVTLTGETGVSVMGNPAYTNVIMTKSREVVKLYANALNSWRIYNENRIAVHVPDVSTADPSATYGTTEQTLLKEIKDKVNLILSTERTAQQRASS